MAQTNGIKDAILQVLMLSKYTKRPELRHTLISRGYFISDRNMRSAVEEMITKDHYSIGSGSKGYYLITTDEDLDEAMHELRAKAEALSIRANCLLRNHKAGKLQEQLDLFI